MGGRLAALIGQLRDIGRHQRALIVEEEFARMRIERERIEAAGKWFLVAQRATRVAQMGAIVFNADAAKFLLLGVRQRYFEGRMPLLDIATSAALSTVLKKHAYISIVRADPFTARERRTSNAFAQNRNHFARCSSDVISLVCKGV